MRAELEDASTFEMDRQDREAEEKVEQAPAWLNLLDGAPEDREVFEQAMVRRQAAPVLTSAPQQQTMAQVAQSIPSVSLSQGLSREELQMAKLQELLQERMLPLAVLSAEVLSPPRSKRRFSTFR